MPSKIAKRVIEDISAFGALPFSLFLMFFVLFLGESGLFLLLFIGNIFMYVFVFIIRFFYHKRRPNKERYRGFLEKIDASSFPSVHSWRLTMATILFHFYYGSFLITLLLALITGAVMYSRYNLKKHYVNDIIFGALFGAIESFLIILIFA